MTLDHLNPIFRPKLPSDTQRFQRYQPLGGVRCYWALLQPRYFCSPATNGATALELDFVYLDPILSTHLGAQNIALTGHGAIPGRGVIEFIHEAERERECSCLGGDRSVQCFHSAPIPITPVLCSE